VGASASAGADAIAGAALQALMHTPGRAQDFETFNAVRTHKGELANLLS
jgi:hypothetical protein